MPGKDAEPTYRPLFHGACDLLLDLIGSSGLGTDGINETRLTYTFLLYSNHDLDVSCEASLGSAQAAADSNYYPSVTMGARSGACGVDIDYPPQPDGVAGFWQFELLDGTGPRVVYQDVAAHPMHNRAFVFTENDCFVRAMRSDGMWMDAALSDAF